MTNSSLAQTTDTDQNSQGNVQTAQVQSAQQTATSANQSTTDTTNNDASQSQSAAQANTTAKTDVTSNSDATNSANTATATSANTDANQTVYNALPADSTTTANANANSNAPVAQASATQASAVATSNDQVPSGGTVYDDYPDVSNNPLGVAAYFHIFANDATLNAHTNGNLAVKNLDGNVNFGTNVHEELLDKEISYIQNITNIANSSFVSAGDTRTNKVIFGENVDIDVSNPNRVNVAGKDIDHLTASETYQDKNGQVYIDFAKEFQNLRDKSTELANTATENPTISNSDFDDQNNRVIDINDYIVNENNQIILNLSPDFLNSNTPLTIKGISSSENGPTVIINVDTGGDSNYDVNSPIKIKYDDGSDRDSQETEYFGDNHLLWNFTDSTASDKLNNGTINMNGVFQGSVLAPNSTINVNQNLDGNIVADKVNVNAETHRWDLQDDTENGEEDFEGDIDEPEDEDDTDEPGDTDEGDTDEPGDTDEGDTDEPGDTDEGDTDEPGDTDEGDTDEPGDTDEGDTDEPGDKDDGDSEEPGVTNPEEPIEGENPGGPEEPATDVDGSEEDDNLITDPDFGGNGEESNSNKDANNNVTSNLADQKDENKQGNLPQTGAESSIVLTAIGAALAAALVFAFKRRRD